MSRRRSSRSLCIVPCLLALLPELYAQNPRGARGAVHAPVEDTTPHAPPGRIEVGKDGFVLPEGAVSVEDLIDSAARYLTRNILCHPQELAIQPQPDFVFQKRLALDALGCEEMLGELLASRGLVVVPIDERRQVYEVIHQQGPRGREIWNRAVPRTPEEVLQRPSLKQMVLVTLPLKHINATIAVNALRPFFSTGNSNSPGIGLVFGTAGTAQALIVTGFTDQVAACIRMLQLCDQPLKERDPEQFELSQAITSLQNAVTDLQARLATAQKQIADLQKAAAEKR